MLFQMTSDRFFARGIYAFPAYYEFLPSNNLVVKPQLIAHECVGGLP
ncbi:hypothetical protein GGD65_007883 [Bradyrhizobium sp. CIR18]|nr:hypothetical protein [Bradyrhizobium sp. CIR18]